MLGLFSKKRPADISRLKVDVHSHLIPGIDDGAQTMDHSLGMINRFVELGYQKLVTTPHVMTDTYNNSPEIIFGGLNQLREAIKSSSMDIEIDAAAEYYFDEFLIERINKRELLTFGDNHVLFEFSFNQAPSHVDELIFAFQSNGFRPVLAHFERYVYYSGIEKAQELRERGVLIQLNLNSLTGHYGKQAQKQAELLIDRKFVDLAGSDCHRIEHLDILQRHLSKKHMHKLLDLDLLNYKL
jgi:tyrosine-protein phosphatase YwqE